MLKTNMVLSGKDASDRADAGEVAEKTVGVPEADRPGGCAGHRFPVGRAGRRGSHGEPGRDQQAGQREGAPWELTFSYGRGLQAAPLKAWGGNNANLEAVQQAYFERACQTAYARQGAYDPDWTPNGS